MGELLDRLRAEDTGSSAAWNPTEAGEGIEGVIHSIEQRDGDESKRRTAYPLISVVTDEGRRVTWHAAGTIAAEQLDVHHPKPGDRIAVLYGGEHRSGGGNRYKRWTIAVEHTLESPVPDVGGPAGESPLAGPPVERGRSQAWYRAEILRTLQDIPEREHRHRAKRTFHRLYGAPPQTCPEALLVTALRWTNAAAAGTTDLDPI